MQEPRPLLTVLPEQSTYPFTQIPLILTSGLGQTIIGIVQTPLIFKYPCMQMQFVIFQT